MIGKDTGMMPEEWILLLTAGTMAVLVVTAGYWQYVLLRSRRLMSRQLVGYYALSALFTIASGALMLRVCVAGLSDENVCSEPLSMCVMLLYPILFLQTKAMVEGVMPSERYVSQILAPDVLYMVVYAGLVTTHSGEEILSCTWKRMLVNEGLDLLISFNMLVYITAIVVRRKRYRHWASNFFSDLDMSDHKSVACVELNALSAGIVSYLVIVLSYDFFVGNAWATSAILCLQSYSLCALGRAMVMYKGVKVPSRAVWSKDRLTLEEVEALESRMRKKQENETARAATQNIGRTINNWVNASKPSYLRASLTIGEAAEEMKIPVNLLSNYLNKVLEVNFNQWINRYRIGHVKTLLEKTDKSLDEIADLTGFSNRSILSRTFKSFEGVSPKEYKRSFS